MRFPPSCLCLLPSLPYLNSSSIPNPTPLQDTNAAQYALVKLLCGPGSSTFVVGDPDQVGVGAVVWRKCGDGAAWGWAATPRPRCG